MAAALCLTAAAQTARVQVIHNSADAAAGVVDVYVNGGAVPAINDFAFRTATPFIDLPAGVDLEIGIAPGNSTGPQDIIPGLTFTYNLADGETYVLVANGIVSPSGYNPAPAFGLDVFAPGREAAAVAGNTDILVIHGSTDAPTVQVAETAVLGGAVVVPPFSFGEFTADYLEVPAVDLTLEIQLPDGTPVVAYDAPLATLGLADAALVAVASGFLNPANNSNGPAFGVWVALPSGGPLVELPLAGADPTARVQVIHNCADAAAAVVDVYINGGAEPAINDFAFRTATPFIDLPAGVDLEIGIAPGNSTGPQDIIPGLTFTYNLADGETYVLVANGIVSPSGYNPAVPFDLHVFAGAREAAQGPGTDVLVFHGATDAPTVDVFESAVVNTTIVDDLAYAEFNGYLELPTLDFTVQIRTADGATTVATYSAPLQTLNLEGAALTVLASGFLAPANNSNGPAFGLWVASPLGGDLLQLPVVTSVSELNGSVSELSVWPNPANDGALLNAVAMEGTVAEVSILDAAGRTVQSLGTRQFAQGSTQLAIETSGLANGTYTVALRGENLVRSIPLMIAR